MPIYSYRSLFRQAWDISVSYRSLWFFGIFAAVLGNGGAFNILVNNLSFFERQGNFFDSVNVVLTDGFTSLIALNIFRFFSHLSIWSGVILILIAGVVGVLAWIVLTAYGALVAGVHNPHDHANQAWKRGVDAFWHTAGVQFFSRMTLYGFLGLVSIPLLALYLMTSSPVWNTLWLFVLFLILVPGAWILAIVVRYAGMYAVLERCSAIESLRRGLSLFFGNWLTSLEVAVMLFAANMAFGIVAALALLVIALPFLLIIMSAYVFGLVPFFWIFSVLFLVSEILAVFLLGAWFSVFQTSVWVLLYERIVSGHAAAKAIRLIRSLFSRKALTSL